jgi:hypothetical protein
MSAVEPISAIQRYKIRKSFTNKQHPMGHCIQKIPLYGLVEQKKGARRSTFTYS